MAFIQIPPGWQLPERDATPETVFWNRRRFLKGLAGAGIAGAVLPLVGCQMKKPLDQAAISGVEPLAVTLNPAFAQVDRPITNELVAATYNNFYEFGSTKTAVWQNARPLPLEDWKVEVGGLVNNPQTFDLDDLTKKFPLEERIYRFRCVEAWAMVIPWVGFPMNLIMKAVEPTSAAKFVRFTSYYNPRVTTGPLFPPNQFLPFPYTEGMRIEEMANDLAFFAVGAYGHTLPKQHGAPLRSVIPWKYGFKGAKSIVKIEFVDKQPATFWNTLIPSEYKFESNVDPAVPHPRWSQSQERFVGAEPEFAWTEKPTLKYNGYEEYVASLYS